MMVILQLLEFEGVGVGVGVALVFGVPCSMLRSYPFTIPDHHQMTLLIESPLA